MSQNPLSHYSIEDLALAYRLVKSGQAQDEQLLQEAAKIYAEQLFPQNLSGHRTVAVESYGQQAAVVPVSRQALYTISSDAKDLQLNLNATVRVFVNMGQDGFGQEMKSYKDVTVLDLLRTNDAAVASGQKYHLSVGEIWGRVSSKEYTYNQEYSAAEKQRRDQYRDQELLIRLTQLKKPLIENQSAEISLTKEAQELLNHYHPQEKAMPLAIRAANVAQKWHQQSQVTAGKLKVRLGAIDLGARYNHAQQQVRSTVKSLKLKKRWNYLYRKSLSSLAAVLKTSIASVNLPQKKRISLTAVPSSAVVALVSPMAMVMTAPALPAQPPTTTEAPAVAAPVADSESAPVAEKPQPAAKQTNPTAKPAPAVASAPKLTPGERLARLFAETETQRPSIENSPRKKELITISHPYFLRRVNERIREALPPEIAKTVKLKEPSMRRYRLKQLLPGSAARLREEAFTTDMEAYAKFMIRITVNDIMDTCRPKARRTRAPMPERKPIRGVKRQTGVTSSRTSKPVQQTSEADLAAVA